MSYMKRVMDEHGICEAYIESQETALNTAKDQIQELKDQNRELADALGRVLDWIDGEAPDFNSKSVEDEDAWNERASRVWWDAYDVLKKVREVTNE